MLVTDGDVANSSKALERFLAQNNVIREWRMSFRHRQKGEERRKLKSVRWRRRFKYEVSFAVTYGFAGHPHLTFNYSRSARKSSLFSKYGDEGHRQLSTYPYDDSISMNKLVPSSYSLTVDHSDLSDGIGGVVMIALSTSSLHKTLHLSTLPLNPAVCTQRFGSGINYPPIKYDYAQLIVTL